MAKTLKKLINANGKRIMSILGVGGGESVETFPQQYALLFFCCNSLYIDRHLNYSRSTLVAVGVLELSFGDDNEKAGEYLQWCIFTPRLWIGCIIFVHQLEEKFNRFNQSDSARVWNTIIMASASIVYDL